MSSGVPHVAFVEEHEIICLKGIPPTLPSVPFLLSRGGSLASTEQSNRHRWLAYVRVFAKLVSTMHYASFVACKMHLFYLLQRNI